MLVGLVVPLAAVTVDLYALSRRRRVRLGPAWARASLHIAPWLVVVGIVYLWNVLGLLPKRPGATIPPESGLVEDPRYLRVTVLLVVLLLAYAYATAIERRLARQVRVDPRAAVCVAHAILLGIAVLVFFVNPYSLLLVAPAAVLWPLARGGGWTRSILPVYLGLSTIAVALAFFALHLDLGVDVWWYFFLLIENRSIPATATLLAAVFVAIAGMLAHTLHGWTPSKPEARTPGHANVADGSGRLPEPANGPAEPEAGMARTAPSGDGEAGTTTAPRPHHTGGPPGDDGGAGRRGVV